MDGQPPATVTRMPDAVERPAGQADRFFVLVCRECWPEASLHHLVGEMPFQSPEARGLWATQHTKGTGHDSWLVIDS